jgi:hypothetical protein
VNCKDRQAARRAAWRKYSASPKGKARREAYYRKNRKQLLKRRRQDWPNAKVARVFGISIEEARRLT